VPEQAEPGWHLRVKESESVGEQDA